jgi:TolB-like protein/DNA-binding winged helix-turn-helix (wHTH) protein/tetratricopeptide (TPR) repeat protein
MSAQARTGTWQIGAWIADPSDDTLTRGTDSLKIEPRMMRLLLCLAKAQGAVVSQDHLLTEVWAGVVVGPASIYQSVSHLRKVLGDLGSPPTYIETVARKGYRLIAPVHGPEVVQPPTPAREPPTAVIEAVDSATKGGRFRWMWWLTAAAVVAFATVGVVWLRLVPAEIVPSIAVLPFVDMTVGKTEQPFCDGVTEELSNWLAQIPTLRVVARRSASAFRDKRTDVREIGRVLGTTHVIEGSLRRSGNAMRVTVQLVATRDGYNVWSGSYDTASTDVIQVQEDVARSVANSLELRLTDVTTAGFADRRSASAHAYSMYLVARHHEQLGTKQDNDRAIELYKQAIDADPKFTLAQVNLAHAYLNQRYFNDRPIASIAQDANPLLESVARRTPQLADLYAVRGALETELFQHDAAIKDFRHALALNPSSRDAAAELGFYYLVSGVPQEALRYTSRAVDLDPLDHNLHAQRCLALADLAQYTGADAACERARTLGPEAAWVYSAWSAFEESRGRVGEALKWNAAALTRSPDVQEIYAERGRWFLSLGLTERARETYETATASVGNAETNVPLTWLGLVTLYAHGGANAMHERIVAGRLDRTDNPLLLFELADAELLAGDSRAARAFVERALASPDLKIDDLASPWLARGGHSYLLTAAAAKQATGDPAGAAAKLADLTALLDRLVAAGMRRHGVYELQAQVAALHGDAEAAMIALQRAADQGWRDVWLAEHQPYFASLRQRADFRALLDRIRADNDAESKKPKVGGPI